jgi:membrane fusion protein (multidrug efflux system)
MYIVTIASACLIGLFGCKKEAGHAAGSHKSVDSAVVKVIVSPVTVRPYEDWVSYSADLRGIEDAVLTAPNQGGRVNSIKEVGARVSAGESLCDIDAGKYEAALEAAKAQVAMTRGDLERATVNVEKGSLGRSVLDGANLGYQNARMVLANAQRAYDDSRCLAPFSGVLVSRSVDKFQTVSPGMPIVRVARIDKLEAQIALPEAESLGFREGMKTEFALLQNPNEKFDGTISSLDGAVDTRSRTITARITIRNKNGILKPGMVGRASILRKQYAGAVVIPSTALVRLPDAITVMVVERGRARQHTVAVGASKGDSTLVTAGLVAGDSLIVSGAFQVTDGTNVAY